MSHIAPHRIDLPAQYANPFTIHDYRPPRLPQPILLHFHIHSFGRSHQDGSKQDVSVFLNTLTEPHGQLSDGASSYCGHVVITNAPTTQIVGSSEPRTQLEQDRPFSFFFCSRSTAGD